MRLSSRIVRKLVRTLRSLFYRMISTAKVEGKFRAVSPVLCEGRGKVCVGEKVVLGFVEDADFWTTYSFLNPRTEGAVISIGSGSQICNHFTAVAEGPGIEIGENVLIGTGVTILDSDFHEIAPSMRVGGTPKMGHVSIANNVWIGERAVILKGSKIGENSVVAAGAVVCGEFPANVVIGGVPAKVIRAV